MNSAVFTTIATTGFTVAFLHAAIPTHWLPFVLASRAQKWNRAKALAVTALAGAGHVLFTTILGVAIVWLGIGISKKLGDSFPLIAGGALILFGLFYLVRQVRGGGHGHHHFFGGHSHAHHEHSLGHGYEHSDHAHTHEVELVEDHHHGHEHTHEHESAFHAEREALAEGKQPQPTSDWVAIGSLFALLTFSPCEGFLPVYLTGIKFGWFGFFVLSAILAGATLAGMVLFTWLTLLGLEKLKLKWFEKYEMGILGGLLCVLGILIMLFKY